MAEWTEDPTAFEGKLSLPWPVYTTDMTPLSNGSVSPCVNERTIAWQLEISVLCSAGILFLLLNILLPRWRGGSIESLLELVVPIKFLDSSPFRLIYCTAMSAWAADIVKNVSESSQYYHDKDKAVLDAFDFFVVSPAVIILKQSFSYFPIMACVDGPVPVVTHALGFLHTLLLSSHTIFSEIMKLQGCSPKGQLTTRDMVFSVVISAPVYVIYLFLALWFLLHALMELPLVLCTRQKLYDNMTPYYHSCKQHFTYVRGLLTRPLMPRKKFSVRNLRNYLERGLDYLLPFHDRFSYPLPFLSAVCMAVLVLYQLSLALSYTAVSYTEKLMGYVLKFNITVETVEEFFPQLKNKVDNLFYDAKSMVLAFNIIIPVAVFIAFAQTLGYIFYMAYHYHKLLLQFARGDLSYLVKSEPLPSVPYRLAATMRYSAFQFSYIIVTWFVYVMMMASLMGFGLLFYLLFKNHQQFGVHLWSWVMVPLMWSGLMHQSQVFLCHFVFLRDKKASRTGFVPVRFKSLYEVLSYFFFFFNVIYGIMMAFLRVLGTGIFTVVMLLRIDWDVYMRGLEGWDVGYRTFVGYIYMECTNNNSIVRAFVSLLQESIVHRPKAKTYLNRRTNSCESVDILVRSTSPNGLHQRHITTVRGSRANGVGIQENSNALDDIRLPKSKQARNRWFVAYTLLRNPSLRIYTASSLRQGATNSVSGYGTF